LPTSSHHASAGTAPASESIDQESPPRTERHRDAEAEGDAEDALRHREEALAERIDERHREGDDAPHHRREVGRENERERAERERGAQRERLGNAHRAARHRPLRGALDVAIELAVGDVVGGAAGAAHQQGADDEDDEQVHTGEAARRDPQRRQRRPEQQQRAGRSIPADQVEIEREAAAPGGCCHVHLQLGRATSAACRVKVGKVRFPGAAHVRATTRRDVNF
jgi:hypothetical protein